MKERNYSASEATPEAEAAWWEHVQDCVVEGLKATTNSWYLGANVAGKARVFMPYYGGFPNYCRKCEEVVAAGYEGFAFAERSNEKGIQTYGHASGQPSKPHSLNLLRCPRH